MPQSLTLATNKIQNQLQICTLVFKCLHAMAPTYLIKLIKIKQQRRQGLRSENINNILEVPKMKRKTFASRAFSVYGPRTWNALPDSLQTTNNYDRFCKDLKTHLFLQAYI